MNFDSVHNYYEHLVIERILENLAGRDDVDEDFVQDVACVALNHLPPRYVRHDVDLLFYMTAEERRTMHESVTWAVEDATRYVEERRAARREAAAGQ